MLFKYSSWIVSYFIIPNHPWTSNRFDKTSGMKTIPESTWPTHKPTQYILTASSFQINKTLKGGHWILNFGSCKKEAAKSMPHLQVCFKGHRIDAVGIIYLSSLWSFCLRILLSCVLRGKSKLVVKRRISDEDLRPTYKTVEERV